MNRFRVNMEEEEQSGPKRETPLLDLLRSVRLSLSEKRIASLRHPVDRTHPRAIRRERAMAPYYCNRHKKRRHRRPASLNQEETWSTSSTALGFASGLSEAWGIEPDDDYTVDPSWLERVVAKCATARLEREASSVSSTESSGQVAQGHMLRNRDQFAPGASEAWEMKSDGDDTVDPSWLERVVAKCARLEREVSSVSSAESSGQVAQGHMRRNRDQPQWESEEEGEETGGQSSDLRSIPGGFIPAYSLRQQSSTELWKRHLLETLPARSKNRAGEKQWVKQCVSYKVSSASSSESSLAASASNNRTAFKPQTSSPRKTYSAVKSVTESGARCMNALSDGPQISDRMKSGTIRKKGSPLNKNLDSERYVIGESSSDCCRKETEMLCTQLAVCRLAQQSREYAIGESSSDCCQKETEMLCTQLAVCRLAQQ